MVFVCFDVNLLSPTLFYMISFSYYDKFCMNFLDGYSGAMPASKLLQILVEFSVPAVGMEVPYGK